MPGTPPLPPGSNPPSTRPTCRGCRHYYVTHDPNFPHGCKALDFKSRQAPVRDVIASSGQDCLYRQPT